MRTTTSARPHAAVLHGRFLAAVFVGAVALLPSALGSAQTHATEDLPRLLECRADVGDYSRLAARVGEDGAALGWTKVAQPNPFLAEFQLAKPIAVFGVRTRRIVFASSGILAVLDGKRVSPQALAGRLGLEAVPVGTNRTLFAKVVKEEQDDTSTVVIRLNVSTVDTHPGKTLAGCEYRVDVK